MGSRRSGTGPLFVVPFSRERLGVSLTKDNWLHSLPTRAAADRLKRKDEERFGCIGSDEFSFLFRAMRIERPKLEVGPCALDNGYEAVRLSRTRLASRGTRSYAAR